MKHGFYFHMKAIAAFYFNCLGFLTVNRQFPVFFLFFFDNDFVGLCRLPSSTAALAWAVNYSGEMTVFQPVGNTMLDLLRNKYEQGHFLLL